MGGAERAEGMVRVRHVASVAQLVPALQPEVRHPWAGGEGDVEGGVHVVMRVTGRVGLRHVVPVARWDSALQPEVRHPCRGGVKRVRGAESVGEGCGRSGQG